jgi:CheY-like chemotaxis protein
MDLPANDRVLVVDDDPGIRRLLVTCLRRRGFRMLEARNGREALVEMRSGHADLVVMDLMMPEVSGWDVLRERAADLSLLRIPMIIISANINRKVIADVLSKRVSAVFAKPFDLDALLAKVTACLEHPDSPAKVAA